MLIQNRAAAAAMEPQAWWREAWSRAQAGAGAPPGRPHTASGGEAELAGACDGENAE